jgi:hypothetical protein
MEFKGDKSGETRILLPNEYGGQYNIKGIKYLKALSEKTTIYDTDKPEYKTLKYPPNSNVRIYYQVEEVRQGDVELGNHYMVVLKRQYFHFLGETFFIVPAWDFNTDYNFLIAWNHSLQLGICKTVSALIIKLNCKTFIVEIPDTRFLRRRLSNS